MVFLLRQLLKGKISSCSVLADLGTQCFAVSVHGLSSFTMYVDKILFGIVYNWGNARSIMKKVMERKYIMNQKFTEIIMLIMFINLKIQFYNDVERKLVILCSTKFWVIKTWKMLCFDDAGIAQLLLQLLIGLLSLPPHSEVYNL